jgi:uncharacterized protein (DUF1499 family)
MSRNQTNHFARGILIMGLLTLIGCAGDRPAELGPLDGQLRACPDSPNCVSSFDSRDSHAIEPIRGTPEAVRQALNQMERVEIITDSGGYIHAEFTSRLMGYVDDVEFLANPHEGVVHVRSASRLGYSDMGVNRERIEQIRSLIANP